MHREGLGQTPPLPIFAAEEGGRRIRVGEFEFLRVPLEGAAGQLLPEVGAEADVAEEDGFGEGAGEVEVRAGGDAAFAGLDPFDEMAGGTGENFRGFAVVFGEFVGVKIPASAGS